MDTSSNAGRALRELPDNERALVQAVLGGMPDGDVALARLRLDNIVSKYVERYKRERIRARRGEPAEELGVLQRRLALLRDAVAKLEGCAQEPGGASAAD